MDDEGGGGDDEPSEQKTQSNGSEKFSLYTVNDELVDKLKLLNYEDEYATLSTSYRPVSRDYFVKSTNAGEQFFLFTTIAAWLIQKAGNSSFVMPQEFDDPNTTIANILNVLRNSEITVNFAPNKLKTGAGECCLYVLDRLSDLALVANDFKWNRAEAIVEEADEDDVVVDQAEMTAEQFDEDNIVAAADDDDNGVLMDLHDLPSADVTVSREQPIEGILHSDTDANLWKLEVERVAPQLKVTIRHDTKDWRMHIEQMRNYQKALADLLKTAGPMLKNIGSNIEKSMERIINREKHLNNQLDPALAKLRAAKDRLAELKEKYKEASGGIAERTETLQRVSDDLDQIKQQIDEKGQRNSDGAPMVKLKQAMVKLESELTKMDIQIGVIEHSLLQSQLRDRASYATLTQEI